ncbi:Uncharacterized protein HZ326_17157 [Fusarium oxysporum f. sp. albedinis]|nr:Uncharacterized protein HZ326_17157 [Fusarium oxysporum f. sp. albedinis]
MVRGTVSSVTSSSQIFFLAKPSTTMFSILLETIEQRGSFHLNSLMATTIFLGYKDMADGETEPHVPNG